MRTNDMYYKYIQGKIFKDDELLQAIKHFKQLSDILCRSGREFSNAHHAAARCYFDLHSYGINRGLFKREDKEY